MVIRRRITYAWLRSWPLLIAAILAFGAGTSLLTDTGDRELAAAALIAMGAVCLGAWITMLAAHDYPGHEIPELGPPGADTPSAGRPDHHTDIPTDADPTHLHGPSPGPGSGRPPTQEQP